MWFSSAAMIQKRRTYTTVAPGHSGIKMAVMNPDRKAVPPLKLHVIQPGGLKGAGGGEAGAGGASGGEIHAQSWEGGEGERWAQGRRERTEMQRAGSEGRMQKQPRHHVPNPPVHRDASPRGQAHWSVLPGETVHVGGGMALMAVEAPRKIKTAWQHPAR